MKKTTKLATVAILAGTVLAVNPTNVEARQHHQHNDQQQEQVLGTENTITVNAMGQPQRKYINHLDVRINNAEFNIIIKDSTGQEISTETLYAIVEEVKQVTINGVEVSADKTQDHSGGEVRADLDRLDITTINEIVIVVDLLTEQGMFNDVKFTIPKGSVIPLSVCPDGAGIDYEIASWQETIKVEVNEENVPEEALPPVVGDQVPSDKNEEVEKEEEEVIPPVVPEPELYNIDILYIDKETEKPIKESYNEGLLQGQDWNVEHLDDEVTIEGYVYDSTNGELVGTNAQGDVVIVVYYTKEVVEEPVVETHDIHIIYQTEDGTHLDHYKEPNVPEGTEYNVTDKANNFTIPGYELKEVTGDPTEGVVKKDVYVYVIFTPVVEEPKDEETEVVPPLDEDNKQEDGEEVEKEEQPLPPLENEDHEEEEEEQPVPPVIEEPEEEVEETVPEEPTIPEEPEAPIVPEEPKEEVEQEQPKEEQQKPVEPVVEQEESDKPVTGINPIIATFGTLLTGIGIKLGKNENN